MGCRIVHSPVGFISEFVALNHEFNFCWIIPVSTGKYIEIKMNNLTLQRDCFSNYVEISSTEKEEKYKFCQFSSNPVTLLSNVTIMYKEKTGVLSLSGVAEARRKAISWLRKERLASWGWRDYTPRGVVALYLASNVTFNGTILEEELMAKETEIKTAVALLRFQTFLGHDDGPLFAGECVDLQAMAILALSCKANSTGSSDASFTSTTSKLYKQVSENLKGFQLQDGSFGNLHTTALITQALISSGLEGSKDWSLNATIQYLMKELDSPSVDFLSVYLTLPILNGKSLMDVYKVNCSANPRKNDEGPDNVVMKDEQELIFWFKTANI
ncbi:Cobalamin binding intrinsic factor like protein [Argiope bruennichi]|uniref:Cobalamin binding intrinsic factor like protein n=1 Tax=Argiope bruennichi TaxID=94029 RepID=A0A8T0DYZ4_ARGBR|nr:Cobalamin binding intrinsic factor like protein [Argiope bruennichi]